MTNARFDVDAYIWRTAGTASAGSPRVSTDLHVKSWPITPAGLVDRIRGGIARNQICRAECRIGPGERCDVGNRQPSCRLRRPSRVLRERPTRSGQLRRPPRRALQWIWLRPSANCGGAAVVSVLTFLSLLLIWTNGP